MIGQQSKFRRLHQAVTRAREGFGPSFIECRTYRIRGHAGCEAQDIAGYRTTGEIEHWKKLCPVTSFQKQLLKRKIITQREINKMAERIENEIRDAFEFALKSSHPEPQTLSHYLFDE